MNHENITGVEYINPGLSDEQFEAAALETFRHQMQVCAPYREYVELLGVNPTDITSVDEIPYLPIELFRHKKVYGAQSEPEQVFTSSGTTGNETSCHHVASLKLYEESFLRGFESFYGAVADYSLFALLPSYMEREGSSLVYMVEKMHALNPDKGGFFLYDHETLAAELRLAVDRGEKILLIGVTFALLDFAEAHSVDLGSGAIVMETGGMKGRRQEVERSELHRTLCRAFGVEAIHSEYGMAEMLSQCYSSGVGVFRSPRWVRVVARSLENPLKLTGGSGGINIIDLANRHSCSFLATGDRGRVNDDGSFEIFGRIENEILRGCNMLTHE